jgi:hypothetical protein
LNASTDPALSTLWGKQEKKAQADRFQRPDAMLIYEVQLEKGLQMYPHTKVRNVTIALLAPTKAEILLSMMEAELGSGRFGGMLDWMSGGLKIEESQ